MLAKVAPASNDFHALARYLVRGRAGTTPDPRRVAWVLSQNLPTDDPELAATYMKATAEASTRTKKAAYHVMIAWHARERPTPEVMRLVAQQTLDLAGLAEHQALIMGHGDKPHPHLHILLNRVHPDTGRAWKATHDFATFDRIMKQLSSVHGCEYAPAHVYNPELTDALPKQPQSRATYAAKRGASTNRPQWSRQKSRKVGESLSEDLTHASTADDVVALLAEEGLSLEAKGRGFVVGTPQDYAKLSSLGLTLTAFAVDRLPLAARPSAPPRVSRPIFTADAVDIARAFHRAGLLTKQDVRETIAETASERTNRSTGSSLSRQLQVDVRAAFAATSALTPANRQRTTAKAKRPQKALRAKHPSRR